MNKGMRAEQFFSSLFHRRYKALLVSDRVLRSKGMGQIDIALLGNDQKITLYEVKSSAIGVEHFYRSRQLKRMRKSALFLSLITRKRVEVKVIAKGHEGL